MFTLLFTMGVVFAQDVGDNRYVNNETKLLRYPDAVEVSATVKKGARVEVVAVGKTLIRIRSGRDFGWVPPDVLSETEPADK